MIRRPITRRSRKGYGLYAQGPVEDPKDLAAAIKRGIEVVKRGEPALIDIVSDGR